MTPERIREWEKMRMAADTEEWVVVARRRDGALAGFHNVEWTPAHPQTVYVDSTGVRREHRGHALGKWLKATMTLRIMDERPDVTDIRTGNADSNDAMLGINRLMGYRPLFSISNCEVSIDAVEKWLADRP